MSGSQNRIKYLDGLRGIAIMLVVFSHYWGSTWISNFPVSNVIASLRIVRQGWIGVDLFFLISGFVIFKTIERCSNSQQFLWRRWLRLFPAMAIVSIITVLFNWTIQPIKYFYESPWYDIMPGLSFISPSFFHAILDIEIKSLHHAFATLYIEVGFYVIFSLLYFYFGWKKATVTLVLLGLITVFGEQILMLSSLPKEFQRMIEPAEWLGMQYYIWFSSGILFAKASQEECKSFFMIAILTGIIASLIVSPGGSVISWQDSQSMAAIVLLFAISQLWLRLQNLLQNPILIFFGMISYPLYLIHETVGLGLIVLTNSFLPDIPRVLLPIPTLVTIIYVAFCLTKYVEPPIKLLLERIITRRPVAVGHIV